jgi:hypothetical protein
MLHPALYAGSQTGAFLHWTKAIKGRANILPHEPSNFLTLGEVFVGLPSGRKLLMCAQCLLCPETRPAYALRKIPFYYLELAKGLEPPTL